MVKRIFVSLCLLLIFSVGLPVHAYAGQADQSNAPIEIAPFWSHTHNFFISLNITNGRAVMAGSVIGRVGTERISVDAVLERVNPNGTTAQIGAWRNITANGVLWNWERVHHVARGHDYRLTLTATVFRNGTSETVSMSRTSRTH